MATYLAKIAETEYRANRTGNLRSGSEIFATLSARTQNVLLGSAMEALCSEPSILLHVFTGWFSSDDSLIEFSPPPQVVAGVLDPFLFAELATPQQVVPGVLDPFLFAVLSYHPYVQAAVTGFKSGRDGSPRAIRLPATWDFFASLKER